MTKREELLHEIEHLDKRIDCLAEDERRLQESIDHLIRCRDIAQAELEDVEKEMGMDYCEQCNAFVPGNELDKDLKCFDCQHNFNEDEFDR